MIQWLKNIYKKIIKKFSNEKRNVNLSNQLLKRSDSVFDPI